MNKLKVFAGSALGVVTGVITALVAHAQAFSVSTSTEATNNGFYLQAAYNETINFLTSTGGLVFMIVISILAIAVWMAVKAPRHIVNS